MGAFSFRHHATFTRFAIVGERRTPVSVTDEGRELFAAS